MEKKADIKTSLGLYGTWNRVRGNNAKNKNLPPTGRLVIWAVGDPSVAQYHMCLGHVCEDTLGVYIKTQYGVRNLPIVPGKTYWMERPELPNV